MSQTGRVLCLWAVVGLAGACVSSSPESGAAGTGAVGGTGGGAVTAAGSGGNPATTGSGGAGGVGAPTGGAVSSGGAPTGGRSGSGGASATGGRSPDGGVDAARAVDASAGTDVDQGSLPNLTLHLAGDSTVMTYLQPTATADEGWGQELGQFFITKVAIDNQAIGGASVASFHASSRWTNIINATRAGDYVMAAFGANDSGTVADRHVEPADFQALFVQMADEVKAKQATFIPVTPSALREFTGVREGNVRLGPYAAATLASGAMRNLLVDDLNARSVALLDMIGPTGAMLLYKGVDKAHFQKAGAVTMAELVANELRRIGSPLAAYLK